METRLIKVRKYRNNTFIMVTCIHEIAKNGQLKALTLIILSLPPVAIQCFSSGCQSIENAGPV